MWGSGREGRERTVGVLRERGSELSENPRGL